MVMRRETAVLRLWQRNQTRRLQQRSLPESGAMERKDKNRLSQAGYDYSAIQSIVNKKLSPSKKSVDEIAREVIHGDWGNGTERKNRISAAGYDYSAVQKRVNELLR